MRRLRRLVNVLQFLRLFKFSILIIFKSKSPMWIYRERTHKDVFGHLLLPLEFGLPLAVLLFWFVEFAVICASLVIFFCILIAELAHPQGHRHQLENYENWECCKRACSWALPSGWLRNYGAETGARPDVFVVCLQEVDMSCLRLVSRMMVFSFCLTQNTC